MSQDDPVLFGLLGDRAWSALSNFHPSIVVVDGLEYATVEHWYQANKADNDAQHEWVRLAATAAEAKHRGRRLQPLRRDWHQVKVDIMREGLLAKFEQHPDLAAVLLSTGDRPIHEAARSDTEWGWMNGAGRDLLGKLLVEIRARLRDDFPG